MPGPCSVPATEPDCREVLVLFPVEQALDDAAGSAGDSPVVLPQVAGGRAEAAGQVGELLRLRGQRVAAGALHEEPVVAGPLAEDIARSQGGGGGRREHPRRLQLCQGRHCARRPEVARCSALLWSSAARCSALLWSSAVAKLE